ncbi:DUF1906 domain-containing protein [Nocardia terpenica]|uniref:Rv2525c-like glycoside hydrolase-like domain-containing protein n=1 Tax=Nocardia terpenica TaxID=455432 RepID=A0A164JV20_9NOCA|nr:DUF1906 domain-containing protein [Nocardia terpenica]KZM70749.1 hypothetical protein AWN90_40020 [Nocardia terpenica]NQE89985.1 DUF1906 domain-containing protein [Nocardia terpenica]
MTLGLDYAAGRPSPDAIKAAGYDFVVRYLSDGGPGLPGKLLTPAEADALRATGIDIVANWETTADRMLDGYPAGVYDATLALAQVIACGGRGDRPIYFSADFDATPDQQGPIDDYLRGAASVLGPGNVGIYGGYWPVSRALDNATARWAWQTDAWSGSNRDPRAHLHQRIQQVTVDGITCDVNEALTDDFGQWSTPVVPQHDSGETPMDMNDFTAYMSNVVSDIKDIRQQLTGGRDRVDTPTGVDITASYPGWPQLGQNPDGTHRTIVDGLAAVLANLADLHTTVTALARTHAADTDAASNTGARQ